MQLKNLAVGRVLNFHSSNWQWRYFYLGVWLLPFLPSLGTITLVIVAIGIWKLNYHRFCRSPFNWGLALFGLWLLLISGTALKPIDSLGGSANFIPFIAAFPAFSLLLRSHGRLRQLAWAIAIPSLLVVVLGMGQLFAGWGNFPILRHIGINLIPYGRPEGRMSSLFMYANIFAAYLLIAFILGLGLWLDAWWNWRREGKAYSFQRSKPVLLSSLIVVLAGIGLIFANSRNAWGIALVACLAFALYLGWRWLVLGMVTAAGTVFWAAWGPPPGREHLRQIVPAFFWARLSDELYERPTATLRSTQWQFAWEMAQQRPWLGWGLRNFTPLYKAEMGLWLGHPHNLFLMLFAEVGIPATIFLCSLVAWVMWRAIALLVREAKFSDRHRSNKLLLFSYLLAFGGLTAFNCFDVTIFDLRLNLCGWILLAAIAGISCRTFRLY